MKKQILFIIALFCAFLCGAQTDQVPSIKISNWKFHTGNDLSWSHSDFNDSSWPGIKVPSRWEKAGYPDYDGYAWYRAKVFIPSRLKSEKYAGIAIKLGHLDDRDSTFLNGHFIGNMNRWNDDRNYLLPFTDPSIKWDAENIIAIQVYDNSGGGGMYGKETEITPVDFVDFVRIDYTTNNVKLIGRNTLSKKITLTTDGKLNISGTLEIKVANNENLSTLFHEEIPVTISVDQVFDYEISTHIPEYTPCNINYKFTDCVMGKSLEAREGVPYILTPPAPDKPRINGAKLYGVRPGSPVIYRIPLTGKRPMKLAVKHLPSGLKFDSEKGIITGEIEEAGEYEIELHAENSIASATRKFTFVVGDKISLTPPMGWNSWNCWGLLVDDQKVRDAADVFIKGGLADYGWSYINIDDGWQASQRSLDGEIIPNDKFPDMNKLTSYVHSKGLKIGLYSSPGELTCGGFLGSLFHEKQDVKTWADWGFDFVKYDWCSYKRIKPDPSLEELKEPFTMLGEYLADQSRDIVFSVCQYGMGHVWEWGAETHGNLWRTTGDIEDTWKSMSKIGFSQTSMANYACSGNWNDPDMLVVGRLGWGDPRPTRLTPDEQYTHISLWSLLAAPLLIGCDLADLDDFTKSLLCNSEVIDINQDPLGKQAVQVMNKNQLQIWTKPLEDGSLAVGIFNLSEKYLKGAVLPWNVLGIEGEHTVRDVWRQQDIGNYDQNTKVNIPAHGVVLFQVRKTKNSKE